VRSVAADDLFRGGPSLPRAAVDHPEHRSVLADHRAAPGRSSGGSIPEPVHGRRPATRHTSNRPPARKPGAGSGSRSRRVELLGPRVDHQHGELGIRRGKRNLAPSHPNGHPGKQAHARRRSQSDRSGEQPVGTRRQSFFRALHPRGDLRGSPAASSARSRPPQQRQGDRATGNACEDDHPAPAGQSRRSPTRPPRVHPCPGSTPSHTPSGTPPTR